MIDTRYEFKRDGAWASSESAVWSWADLGTPVEVES